MIGINQEKFERLIEKNKIFIEGISDCSGKVSSSLIGINDSYKGKTLDDVFFQIRVATETLKNIDDILDSYVIFLDSVKKSYVLQDISFSTQINHKNQKEEW